MDEKLQERFNALPKALQNAITSAEIEKKLRDLSEVHKLHLDQWQKLENEVMLALLGFQPVENLEENIKKEVGISDEDAGVLAGDIAETIFQPIREELERELGKPTTEEEKISSAAEARIETPAQKIIESVPPVAIESKTPPTPSSAPAPVASTPPAAAPTAKSVRATLSPAYAPDTKSHERTTVDDDPYREPIA